MTRALANPVYGKRWKGPKFKIGDTVYVAPVGMLGTVQGYRIYTRYLVPPHGPVSGYIYLVYLEGLGRTRECYESDLTKGMKINPIYPKEWKKRLSEGDRVWANTSHFKPKHPDIGDKQFGIVKYRVFNSASGKHVYNVKLVYLGVDDWFDETDLTPFHESIEENPIYPKEWEWRELEIGEKVVLIAGPVTGIEIGSVGTVKDRHVSPRKKRRMYKVSFGDKGTVWLPEKYLISLFRSETN